MLRASDQRETCQNAKRFIQAIIHSSVLKLSFVSGFETFTANVQVSLFVARRNNKLVSQSLGKGLLKSGS